MCFCVHGSCSGDSCICEPRWLGNNCQISTEAEARIPAFIAYRIIFAGIYWVLTGYIGRKLGLVIRSRQVHALASTRTILVLGQKCPSTPILCLSTLFASAIIRAFYYSIDPHSWRGVFIWQANNLLMNTPLVLFMIAFCVNLIIWMRMQIQFAATSDFSVRFVSFQPYILKFIVVAYPILVLVEESLYAAGVIPASTSAMAYNLATVFTILYIIGSAAYFGGKVMSYLKRSKKNMTANTKIYSRGLLSMTKIVVGGAISGAVGALLLIVLLFAGCGSLRLGNCQALYQSFLRIPEIVTAALMVSAVSASLKNDKRPNDKQPSAHNASGNNGPKPHHSSHRSQRSQASVTDKEVHIELTITNGQQKDEKEKDSVAASDTERKQTDTERKQVTLTDTERKQSTQNSQTSEPILELQ